METACEVEPFVDVAIRPSGPCWLLSVTIGVINPIPSGLDRGRAFHSRPYVSLMIGQDPPCHLQLLPENDWSLTRRLLFDPAQPCPRIFLIHWSHFSRDGSSRFEIHLWEVVYSFAPLYVKQHLIMRTSAPPGTRIDGCDTLYLSEGWDIGIAEGLKSGAEQDRGVTPIEEEEQKDIIKDERSPKPTRNTRAWFLNDHHNEVGSLAPNPSACGQSTAKGQQIEITRTPPQRPKTR